MFYDKSDWLIGILREEMERSLKRILLYYYSEFPINYTDIMNTIKYHVNGILGTVICFMDTSHKITNSDLRQLEINFAEGIYCFQQRAAIR